MEMIAQIKTEIAQKRLLERDLKELKVFYTDKFATKIQKNIIAIEIEKIQNELGIQNNFQYSIDEIMTAKPTQMLIDSLIPATGIIVITGTYGSGKSTFAKYLFKSLLTVSQDVFVRYVDADNPVNKLQEFGIHELMQRYENRFEYYGKREFIDNITDAFEEVMHKVIEQQKAYPERFYIVFEDNLKNIMRKNKQGFADINHLYRLEKEFQAAGGTTIILHHTNKQGIFADSKDIVNFADLAYYISFKESTNSIVLEPDKQSRYHVEPKAFFVDPLSREISHEVDYRLANISTEEVRIVQHVKELLEECGEFNQNELERETRGFRNNIGIGEKRFRAILKKHDGDRWKTTRGMNNSLIFQPTILPNVPNDVETEIESAKPVGA